MIQYEKFELDNGLRVVVHEDPTTPMAVVNVLYDVGARDENPEKTGFAHLFEHLMFGGSANIPDFDPPLHRAGGECNAFTNSDLTNYYDIVPANNIETAFWLESDRMMQLDFSQASLDVQKNVVCEEFKENYINQPYGDVWHKLHQLCYQKHPYQWPVIGKELSHIENASLEDVQHFFYKHYRPNNAVLSVAGGVKTADIKTLAQKWFGTIPSGQPYHRQLPQEPPQTQFRSLQVEADVPLDAIYMAFKMCSRRSPNYYATDMLGDVLSSGASGRFYQQLVKQKKLFNTIGGYGYDFMDEGLFIVSGKLAKGVDMQTAEAAIWEELTHLQNTPISTEELEKIKNKVESSIVFSEISLRTKAFSLAYYELLGDITEINNEIDRYLNVSAEAIQGIAKNMFNKEKCSVIYYQSNQKTQNVS